MARDRTHVDVSLLHGQKLRASDVRAEYKLHNISLEWTCTLCELQRFTLLFLEFCSMGFLKHHDFVPGNESHF